MKAAALWVLTLCLWACDQPAHGTGGPPRSDAPATPAPRSDASVEQGAASAGPAAPGAPSTRELREKAVLDLLAGGDPVTLLPVAAVDPGKVFDPAQRDKVAPSQEPKVKAGTVSVGEGIPAKVVERIVRQNFGRFRLCYENALRTKPELGGTVVVTFAIDKTGSVAPGATSTDSTITDGPMQECVRRAFGHLRFPEPEKGRVEVTYTVVFSPTG